MSHKLNSKDQWFIDLERKDPLTQSVFKTGDEVVICEHCNTVILKSSWDDCLLHNRGGCCICGKSVQKSAFGKAEVKAHVRRSGSKSFHVVKKDGQRVRSFFSRESIISVQHSERIFNVFKYIIICFFVLLSIYALINWFKLFDSKGLDFKNFNDFTDNCNSLVSDITQKFSTGLLKRLQELWGLIVHLWDTILKKAVSAPEDIYNFFKNFKLF